LGADRFTFTAAYLASRTLLTVFATSRDVVVVIIIIIHQHGTQTVAYGRGANLKMRVPQYTIHSQHTVVLFS
jgi:hypothetical protein